MKFFITIIFLITNFLYSYENLDFLNKIRQNLGLQPLFINNELSLLSKKHLDYMIYENKVSHEEININNPHYLGYKVQNRIINFNKKTTFNHIGENISIGYLNLKDSIENLIDAPYHRFNFLRDFDHIGMAYTNKFNKNENLIVYTMGKKSKIKHNKIIIYPYSNQQNVKTFFFSDSEEPDPVKNKNIVGYPITIVNFKYNKPIFQLVNETRNKIEKIIVKSEYNDKYIKKNEFLIVPIEILDYNNKYTLRILCEDNYGNKKIFTSSFSTKSYEKVKHIKDYNNYIHIKEGKPPYFVKLRNNQKIKLESNQFRLKNLNELFILEDSY